MPLGSAEALALTGMMGSGKSTAARALGLLLRRKVASTDALVEARAGKPVARIFAEHGEPAFRALEREAVGALAGPLVVDLGGGAFCDPESAARLLAVARVVFLDVSAAEAARRLAGARASSEGPESRPLASRWEPLLARRLPMYLRAHHRVEVDALAPEAVARRVLGLVGGGA